MDEEDRIGGMPRRSGPGLAVVVLVSLVVSIAASAGTVLVMERLRGGVGGEVATGPAPIADAPEAAGDVAVPDFAGVPEASARGFLETEGLRLAVRSRRNDPTVAAGSIIEQVPAARTMLARGGTVGVVVSDGPEPVAAAPAVPVAPPPGDPTGIPAVPLVAPTTPTAPTAPAGDAVEVPRVVGQRLPRARTMLEAAGLRAGAPRYEYDEDRGQHVVLRQTPEAGTTAARGTEVRLVVNQGD